MKLGKTLRTNSLSFLVLKRTISSRRLFFLAFGLIISATIFGAATTLMLGVYTNSLNYLGESDDVLIISSEKATTPFTSHIPSEIVSNVKELNGIISVSAEVICPVIINDQSSNAWGINPSTFFDFTTSYSLTGRLWSAQANNEAVIGIKLAQRLGLSVGDKIILSSTLKPISSETIITGIITTNSLIDEDILIPLLSAQQLAYNSVSILTHARVKIDLEVTTKEAIRRIINDEFTLTVQLAPLNGSTTLSSGVLKVQDLAGKLVDQVNFKSPSEIVSLNLPFRKYHLVYTDVSGEIGRETLFLKEDLFLEVEVGSIARGLFINATDQGGYAPSTEIMLQSSSDLYPSYWTTDSHGLLSLFLSEGWYTGEATYQQVTKEFSFLLNQTYSISLPFFDEVAEITVSSPSDGSIIFQSSFPLLINSTGVYTTYSIDEQEPVLYDPLQTQVLTLSEGDHFLKVNSTLDGFFFSHKTVHFSVQLNGPSSAWLNTLGEFTARPSTQMTVLFDEGWDVEVSWDNTLSFSLPDEVDLLSSTFSVTSPSSEGYHTLYILYSLGNQSFIDSLSLYLKEYVSTLGISIISTSEVVQDQRLYLWASKYSGELSYRWDNGPWETTTNSYLKVPFFDLLGVLHFLEIKTFDLFNGNSWSEIFYYYVTVKPNVSLTADLDLDNLQPGSTIHWNITGSSDSHFYQNWGYGVAPIFNNTITVPHSPGNYFLDLIVVDEYNIHYPFSFNLTVLGDNQSEEHLFYLHERVWGLISHDFLTLSPIGTVSDFTYIIQGETSFSGSFTDELILFLPNGSYSFNLTGSTANYSSSYYYDFTIAPSQNTSSFELVDPWLSSPNISLERYTLHNHLTQRSISGSFNISETIILSDALYSLAYQGYDSSSNQSVRLTLSFTIDTLAPSPLFDDFYYLQIENEVILQPEPNYLLAISISQDLTTIVPYQMVTLPVNFTLADGIYQLNCWTWDLAGNLFQYSKEFAVDSRRFDLEVFIHCRVTGTNTSAMLSMSHLSSGTSYNYFAEDGFGVFSLPHGLVSVKVETEDDTYLTIQQMIANKKLNITLGLAKVKINFFDLSSGKAINGMDIKVIRSHVNAIIQNVYTSESSASIFVLPAAYRFEFEHNTQVGYIELNVSTYHEVDVFLSPPLVPITFDLQWLNGTPVYGAQIEAYSPYLAEPITISGVLSKLMVLLPLGEVNITFEIEGITYTRELVISISETIVILLPSTYSSSTGPLDSGVISKFSSLGLSVQGSDDYLSSYLDGPLALSLTIIIAELILIILVVAVNLSTIINNLLSESKQELLILKSLGAEDSRIWFSYSSRFLVVGAISSAMGHMLGFLLVNFLSSKGATRLLGHNYSPQNSWLLLGINVAITSLLVLIVSLIVYYRNFNGKILGVPKTFS